MLVNDPTRVQRDPFSAWAASEFIIQQHLSLIFILLCYTYMHKKMHVKFLSVGSKPNNDVQE